MKHLIGLGLVCLVATALVRQLALEKRDEDELRSGKPKVSIEFNDTDQDVAIQVLLDDVSLKEFLERLADGEFETSEED